MDRKDNSAIIRGLAKLMYWAEIVCLVVASILLFSSSDINLIFGLLFFILMILVGLVVIMLSYRLVVGFADLLDSQDASRKALEKLVKIQAENRDAFQDLLEARPKGESASKDGAADQGRKAKCPHCGSELELPDGIVPGQHVLCPDCGNKFSWSGE